MAKSRRREREKGVVWLERYFYSLIAIAVFGLIYVFQIEPNWFEIVPVNLTIPNLSAEFDGFKIVEISDLHADTSMTPKKLQKIVRLIAKQQPDVITMTGDFVTVKADADTARLLENTFKQFSPTEKTLAVLGNHDRWSNPEEIRTIFKNANVIDISNSLYRFERGDAQLASAGVDDYWTGDADLDAVLAQLEPLDGVPAILLPHEPDFADLSAATGRFSLQISGHSHGG